MDVVASFPADPQSAEAVQPGDRPLDHIPEDAQAAAVLLASFGKDRADTRAPSGRLLVVAQASRGAVSARDRLVGRTPRPPERISEESRAIYAQAYDTPEALTAGFGVFHTFHQDVADNDSYPPLEMPALAITNQGADFMRPMMEGKANDIRYSGIEDSGHFVAEEQPEVLVAELEKFFG